MREGRLRAAKIGRVVGSPSKMLRVYFILWVKLKNQRVNSINSPLVVSTGLKNAGS